MEPPGPPKTGESARTTMTEYVLPTHANAMGNVFGGQVLAWMDLCAAICAQRFAGHICVTAGIDDLSFDAPIQVGQVVRLQSHVTATFRSSLEVFVDVRGEDASTGRTWPCVSGYLTFVCFKDGQPAPLPQLLTTTPEERAALDAARTRRTARLARRASATRTA